MAWDTCRDRFAFLESVAPPRIPLIPKGGSRKAKEAAAVAAPAAAASAAVAAQAAVAAASAASSASVQVRILLDDGTSNILMRSIGGHSELVSLLFLPTDFCFTLLKSKKSYIPFLVFSFKATNVIDMLACE